MDHLAFLYSCHPVLNLWTVPGFWIHFICHASDLFALQTDLLVWPVFFLSEPQINYSSLNFILFEDSSLPLDVNLISVKMMNRYWKKSGYEDLNYDGRKSGSEHLQNGRSCEVFLVCWGCWQPKVLHERSPGEQVTESWVLLMRKNHTAHWSLVCGCVAGDRPYWPLSNTWKHLQLARQHAPTYIVADKVYPFITMLWRGHWQSQQGPLQPDNETSHTEKKLFEDCDNKFEELTCPSLCHTFRSNWESVGKVRTIKFYRKRPHFIAYRT